MSENVNKFIDSLQKGDNAEAGENFKAALRDKVAQSLDKARVDVASKIFNGVPEAEPHSDPKPEIADPGTFDKEGNVIDMSQAVKNEYGIDNAYLKIYPIYESRGNKIDGLPRDLNSLQEVNRQPSFRRKDS